MILLVLFSCNKSQDELPVAKYTTKEQLLLEVPEGFPEISFPDDNQFSVQKWELGKQLFYDPILSIDSTISCASCHKIDVAFADNVPISKGVFERLGTRNAPSLANIGYHPYFLREGGVPTLEMQALVPIQEFNEFNHNIVDISEQLKEDEKYRILTDSAFNRVIDPFVITRALGIFQRTLVSGNSRYDKYVFQNQNTLSSEELKGLELFESDKTNCIQCHTGFNFTSYEFENNGLYIEYSDIGRMRFTNDSSDLSKFKIPSLRNVELTAPYMHDGSISTLEEVIEHYDSGGMIHQNKSELIRPLNLTDEEKSNLIAFLKTLTDHSFTNNSLLK